MNQEATNKPYVEWGYVDGSVFITAINYFQGPNK